MLLIFFGVDFHQKLALYKQYVHLKLFMYTISFEKKFKLLHSKKLCELVYCTVLYLIITSTQQQKLCFTGKNAYCEKIYASQSHLPISFYLLKQNINMFIDDSYIFPLVFTRNNIYYQATIMI